MSDEAKLESQEIVSEDFGEEIAKEALAIIRGESTTEQKEPAAETKEGKDDQSQEEVKEEPKEEAETKEPPQPAAGTEKAEEKQPYTLDEFKAIAASGDFSKFDSSRLTPGEQAAIKSIQAGLTPKLQEAAELRKERDTLAQRIRAEEERKARDEAAKLYEKEKEEFGDEIANYKKDVRELRQMMDTINHERQLEKAAIQSEQQQVAAQKFHFDFITKAKDYGLPVTNEVEEQVMSTVLAENTVRQMRGEQFIGIDDAMKKVSDTMGLTDPDKLINLISANPKLMEALEAKFGEKISKKKAAGPTVVKASASGSSSKPEAKPNTADANIQLFGQPYDLKDDIAAEAMKILREQRG